MPHAFSISVRLHLLLCLAVCGCFAPLPSRDDDSTPDSSRASADYDAGRKAAAALAHGYADVLDAAAARIDAGEQEAGRIFSQLQTGAVQARKAALEPLETQLDRSCPPDKPLNAKPFRDAARGMRSLATDQEPSPPPLLPKGEGSRLGETANAE